MTNRPQVYGPTPISRKEAIEGLRRARAEIEERMRVEVERYAATGIGTLSAAEELDFVVEIAKANEQISALKLEVERLQLESAEAFAKWLQSKAKSDIACWKVDVDLGDFRLTLAEKDSNNG